MPVEGTEMNVDERLRTYIGQARKPDPPDSYKRKYLY